jgi:AcrR family transcriptional regulator
MAKRRHTPLSVERILDAASDAIEQLGPEFSMRALGKQLGVEAMSVYHHFPSKAHLLDALLDRLLLQIPSPDEGLPWPKRVRAFCYSYRSVILSRPAFAHFALTHRMNTPTGLATLERFVSLFLDEGFTTEAAARAFRALGYYLMGSMLDETAGYARGASAAEELTLEQQRQIAPGLISMGRWFKPKEWDATFDFGLDLFIEQLDALRRQGRLKTKPS